MAYYAGIDASLETVNVCVVDEDGTVALERKIEAEPDAIVGMLKRFGHSVVRVGLEAGPTASWLYSELRAAEVPAICMECRHVKAGLGAMRNKTDRNDARGIAQLVRLGWFRHVFVKSEEAQRIRMLLVGRNHLLNKSHDLENCIRGSLRVFGLRIGTVTRRGFEARVLELIDGSAGLQVIVEPLLRARGAMIEEFERLDRLCRDLARRDPICRRLMSVPGVGVVVALTYRTGRRRTRAFLAVSGRRGTLRPDAAPLQFGADGLRRPDQPMRRRDGSHCSLSGSTRPAAPWQMVVAQGLGDADRQASQPKGREGRPRAQARRRHAPHVDRRH